MKETVENILKVGSSLHRPLVQFIVVAAEDSSVLNCKGSCLIGAALGAALDLRGCCSWVADPRSCLSSEMYEK